MIKIIEKGTRHKIRCKDCGCLFSFDDEDVNIRTGLGIWEMEVRTQHYEIIVCPQCENEIVLNADNQFMKVLFHLEGEY